jgi:hypothetical protein
VTSTRHSALRTFAALTTTTALALLAAPTAQAQGPSTSTSVRLPVRSSLENLSSRGCLESNEADDTGTYTCDHGVEQTWTYGGDGTLQNSRTGRCLSMDDYNGVVTDFCSQDPAQQWQEKGTRIVNLRTGRCLATSEGWVYGAYCDTSAEVNWRAHAA